MSSPSQPLCHGQRPEFTVCFTGQTKYEVRVCFCVWERDNEWELECVTCINICCTTELYLEAVFKLLADKVEDNGVYAGVDCCKVDAKIVQDQQEAENREQKKRLIIITLLSTTEAMYTLLNAFQQHTSGRISLVAVSLSGIVQEGCYNSLEQLTAHAIILGVHRPLQDPAEVQREPAEGKDEDEAEDGFGHLPPLEREWDGGSDV